LVVDGGLPPSSVVVVGAEMRGFDYKYYVVLDTSLVAL
jgi:hypothetical protein